MLSLPSTSGHCLRWKPELRCMENAHHRGVNTLVASQSTFLNWKSRSSFLEGIAGKEVRVGELFRRCGNRRQDCGVPHLVARASISYRSKLVWCFQCYFCIAEVPCFEALWVGERSWAGNVAETQLRNRSTTLYPHFLAHYRMSIYTCCRSWRQWGGSAAGHSHEWWSWLSAYGYGGTPMSAVCLGWAARAWLHNSRSFKIFSVPSWNFASK